MRRMNEVLGVKDKPMKLSEIDANLAKAAAAPEAGMKDQKDEDDKASVNMQAKEQVGALSPAQKEVIPMKALSFALGYLDNQQPDLDDMEAIVSSDKYIMDGHHRWAAATLVDPKKSVKVAKIDLPANELITALNVYTKGALNLEGNEGVGDLDAWRKLIVEEINKAFEKGFSKENGNAILPGKGKPNWPMYNGDTGKSADEVKKLFGKMPGANGDAEKGKEIMLKNAQQLKTTRLPTAPERIDMPVIDAGLTPDKQKTDDVKKSQLYDVCKRIENGTLDLMEPYNSEVSAALKKESHVIKVYERFIQQYRRR